MRATDHDIPMIHRNRQTNQGKSFTGTIDAQTGIRFIDCPMGEADEVSAVIGEELIPNEIKRSGHVTTPIDVGVIISLIVDEETVDSDLLADEPKFLYGSRRHLLRPRNDPPYPRASAFHLSLTAHKKEPAHHKTQ